MAKRRIPKREAKTIATERIEVLMSLTEKETREGRQERARRYIELAMRIGMRYNISVSRWKRKFCPECKTYYMFPSNASIRLKNGRIIVKCKGCGNVSRYPYKG